MIIPLPIPSQRSTLPSPEAVEMLSNSRGYTRKFFFGTKLNRNTFDRILIISDHPSWLQKWLAYILLRTGYLFYVTRKTITDVVAFDVSAKKIFTW